MSAVMMCDNCGNMFSVNEKGWRSFNEEWNGDPQTRDVFVNAYNHNAITRHIGPCCALVNQTVRPRLALETAPEDKKR